MIDIILLMIFILIYIDYYYKKYRIKRSKKDIRPRNSHSFYDFTDYKKYKPYEEDRSIKFIIIFLLIILVFEGFKNIDKIDFNKIKSNIEKSKIQATTIGKAENFNSNYIYTDNDKKQYEIAMYYINYSKHIEPINIITKNIIENGNLNNYYDINVINDELIVIDDLLKNFISYIPSDINKNLHNLNIKILICYENLYNIALLLNNNNNQEIIDQYKYKNDELINYYIEFRKEILKIFDDINMTYNIDENDIIHFTYKDLKY